MGRRGPEISPIVRVRPTRTAEPPYRDVTDQLLGRMGEDGLVGYRR